MKTLAPIFSFFFFIIVPGFCLGCDKPETKHVISVPSTETKTIYDAIEKARSYTDNEQVFIEVEYGQYDAKHYPDKNKKELKDGLLIDRPCLQITGKIKDGKNPVIKRSKFAGHEPSVVQIRANNVTFEGFDVKGEFLDDCKVDPYGILVLVRKDETDLTSGLTGIRINNNIVQEVGHKKLCGQAHGIMVWNDRDLEINDVCITGNTLTNLRLGSSETMTIKHNVNGFSVSNNTIYNVDNIAIDVVGFEEGKPYQAKNGKIISNVISGLNPGNSAYPYVAGIYIDGGRDILVDRNKITGFGFGIEIASEQFKAVVEEITVSNNLLHGNFVSGIGIGHGLDLDPDEKEVHGDQRNYVKNCYIVNNTIYGNIAPYVDEDGKPETMSDGKGGGNIRIVSHLKNGFENVIIANNIVQSLNNERLIYWENWDWGDGEVDCVKTCCGSACTDENDEKEKKCAKKCYKDLYEKCKDKGICKIRKTADNKYEKLQIKFFNNLFYSGTLKEAWYLDNDGAISSNQLPDHFFDFGNSNYISDKNKPDFFDPPKDFSLKSTSPAIGAGVTEIPGKDLKDKIGKKDICGNIRIKEKLDLGAFEFNSANEQGQNQCKYQSGEKFVCLN